MQNICGNSITRGVQRSGDDRAIAWLYAPLPNSCSQVTQGGVGVPPV